MEARSQGGIGRLISPLIKPSVFDFWASHINSTWSWDRPLARVVARYTEAQDCVTLVLKLNRHCAAVKPGQHLNVSAEVNGRRVTRSYSPSRIARSGRRVSITIKHVEGGVLSTHLCRHADVGDVLELGTPFGEMSLPTTPTPLLFLAAGSGITPLMCLTRQWDAAQSQQPLTLIYWAKTRAELCFVPELKELAARKSHFKLVFALTQETHRLEDEKADRISEDGLKSLASDWASRAVFACGPAGFVESARFISQNKSASFVGEAFTPAASVAAVSDATGTVRINFAASGRSFEVAAGQALLPALEAQGLFLPSGCRMGICNTCACSKQAGTTQNLTTGEQDSEPSMALRLCVSRACTDLTLDL